MPRSEITPIRMRRLSVQDVRNLRQARKLLEEALADHVGDSDTKQEAFRRRVKRFLKRTENQNGDF